jgi:hypothetical protein
MLKLLFSFLIISQAFAQKMTLDDRRKKIVGIVDEELAEVSRLARQQDFKRPDTLLRVSELNLEKARLWREAENEKYLAIPPEERKTVSKSSYFKTSEKLFGDANDSALVVVKRFPSYKGLGEVYYILAYNNKELGNHPAAQKYFKLADQKAGGGSNVSLKSKLAQADYYYNDHKYKEAIPLYEASINKINERWWTKDSFNLAWSYYRVKNYDRAITLMKEIHMRSADPKYIDMRSTVERDIGVFFVDAGRMNDAIKFYEGLGLNYTEQFIKIANLIGTQGRFAQAQALLEQAAKTEKDRGRRIEILIAQLDLFDKYGKVAEHLKVSQELVAFHKTSPLSEDDLKRLKYHVDKKAAELQKATASSLYANVPQAKKQKSLDAIAYFDLSAQLSPGQKAEKTFFQGETAYAAGSYDKAVGLYLKAFDDAQASKDKKTQGQVVEAMLAALSKANSPEKLYVPVYTRYLAYDSKSERAQQIYLKLFNSQYDGKDIPAAEKTMADFAAHNPKDYKTQEGMLAKIMEHYREKKDYSKVKEYVSRINSGEFKVSTKYADALRTLMTKIQIEGVQQSLEKGHKDVALKGYHQIYNNADSTPKAKVNAAYNLSALYYELGDSTQSYRWGVIAVKDMDAEDVNKLGDSYLGIAGGLFLRQQFSASADLSYRVLAKLCKQNSSNKVIAYKNAVFISLANGDIDKATEIRDFGKSCSVSDQAVSEVTFELVKELGKAKRWEIYQKNLEELEVNSKNYPHLIRPYEDLRKELAGIGEAAEAKTIENKQQKFFNQARQQKLDIPVEALDLMSEKMIHSVIAKKNSVEKIQLAFPENEFNSAVKKKLSLLDQMTTEVGHIQKLGSGKGIVEASQYVIEAYEAFGNELKAFSPPGKSAEYVDSFQKAMAGVYAPILQNARKQRQEIKSLIYENKILTQSNYNVLYPSADSFKRFVPLKESVLMERGGKR